MSKRISQEIPTVILQIFFRGVHKCNLQAGSSKTLPRPQTTELVERKEIRKLKRNPNICNLLEVQDAAWLETKRRPVFMDHKGHQTLQVPTFTFLPRIHFFPNAELTSNRNELNFWHNFLARFFMPFHKV